MRSRFVTLSAGGRPDLTAWAHVSILSAMAWAPPDSEFCVVTDEPESFGWFGSGIRILPADHDTLQRWRGRHDFFWRTELMCVIHAAAQGPANIIYHDSDVLFRRNLAPLCADLEAGDVFLHEKEYDLSRARRRGQKHLWSQVRGREVAGFRFTAPHPMWNAGLIAVGAQHQGLLHQALDLLDRLMDDGVHHNLVEQLAIGTAFEAGGRLRPGEPLMDHFWNNKDGYAAAVDRLLARIFTLGLDFQAAAALVRREPLVIPLVVRRRWWSNFLARLAGHGPLPAVPTLRPHSTPTPAQGIARASPLRESA
ncbi:MAG: hypothetical protein FJ381_15490 [Verrucomicrobia bacterium]|nr:hypothetical protein [Verrucomicrobiota bacterium]